MRGIPAVAAGDGCGHEADGRGLRPTVLVAFGSCARHLAAVSVKGGSAEVAAGAAFFGGMRM